MEVENRFEQASRPAVSVGNARLVDARRNVVFAEEGSVVLFGVEDLVVVRTGETTMVLPRERAADLKTLLAALEAGPS